MIHLREGSVKRRAYRALEEPEGVMMREHCCGIREGFMEEVVFVRHSYKATWSHIYDIADALMERQFSEFSLKTNVLINRREFL